MILDELVLVNYGIYRGEHRILLTPPSPERPIVLFGGMNGAGKTTLLDALQLVFYGKLARCSNRSNGSYDDFLAASINRHSTPEEGARLDVQFRRQHEGADQIYRVSRSWRQQGMGIRESLDVFVGGEYDPTVSQAWPDYAEEIIPSRLANLFFFDGEKIEALADLDKAGELLKTAVHSLLGLDIVDTLNQDLGNLIARKAKESIPENSAAVDAEKLGHAIKAMEANAELLFQQRTSSKTRLEQAHYRVQRLGQRLQSEGGDLFQQKDAIQSERTDVDQRVHSFDESIRSLAADALPLLMVDGALARIRTQSQAEREAQHAETLQALLAERDKTVIAFAQEIGIESVQRRRLLQFLKKDQRRRTAVGTECYLGLSDDARGFLRSLSESESDLRGRLDALLGERRALAHEMLTLDRKLKAIPDEDAIRPLLDELATANDQCEALERELAQLEREEAAVRGEIERTSSALGRLQGQLAESQMKAEDTARVVRYSRSSQEILSAFRKIVVERHIESIQRLVLECFTDLARKHDLLGSITINPKTFEVRLFSNDGALLSPDRLSAGERQLLAVSLLWGLAKASNRPLPAVIDTPLGRLDSSHRKNLVERYFPHASHQVLLLSTNEEIRGDYLQALSQFIGHHYLLDYDEESKTTNVRIGYFDGEAKQHAA